MEKYGWVRKHALPSLELVNEPVLVDAEDSETDEPKKNSNGSGDRSE